MVHLGAIWESFGSHFYDFLEIGWISENVCFTIVKPYFLRSGRVWDRDFFVLRFRSHIFDVFLAKLCGFVGFQGPQRTPNGSLLETLRAQTWSKLLF